MSLPCNRSGLSDLCFTHNRPIRDCQEARRAEDAAQAPAPAPEQPTACPICGKPAVDTRMVVLAEQVRGLATAPPSAPPEGDAAEHYLTIGTMYTGGHIPTPHHDGVWPMTIERVDEDVAVPPEGHGDET